MSNFELLQCNVGELYFISDSSVANCVRRREFHDPGVEFIMRRYSDRLAPFFDIGANVGLFSFIAADLLPEDAQIVAFEPDADNLELLAKNIALRGTTNIRVVESAVSQDSTPLKFGKIDCGVAQHSKSNVVEIKCCSLDEFCVENDIFPKFLKIDVEGGEIGVIKGAEKTLRSHQPLVEMEFSYRDHHQNLDAIYEHFPLHSWDMECHLRDFDKGFFDLFKNSTTPLIKVEHVATKQVFWPVMVTNEEEARILYGVLEKSTKEKGSRKWEMVFSPKKATRPLKMGVKGGFKVEVV